MDKTDVCRRPRRVKCVTRARALGFEIAGGMLHLKVGLSNSNQIASGVSLASRMLDGCAVHYVQHGNELEAQGNCRSGLKPGADVIPARTSM
jgi:hypothetical protein